LSYLNIPGGKEPLKYAIQIKELGHVAMSPTAEDKMPPCRRIGQKVVYQVRRFILLPGTRAIEGHDV
jgi:hypothetical protein